MASKEWHAPEGYKITTQSEMKQLMGDQKIRRVIDPVSEIAHDSFEMHHTASLEDKDAREVYVNQIIGQGVEYGRWFHYSPDDILVRFPESDEHYGLRTFRNRNLITVPEQQTLRNKKIAAFGLSVGSKVVDEMVGAGIGDEYLLFDYDRLTPTNLNRIRAKMSEVGLLKTTIEGRKISEIDPYILQKHFINGYEGDKTDAVLRVERPDVIVEEVDDLEAKARIRRVAQELGVPLVMAGDVADKSTIDIERHDREAVKPFNGKLSEKQVEALLEGTMSDKDREAMLIKILGLRNISPRLLDSAVAKANGELAGFPQLGSTATTGGAIATVAIRDIFLDRRVESVASVYDPRKVIGQNRPTSRREDIAILGRFLRHRLRQNKEE